MIRLHVITVTTGDAKPNTYVENVDDATPFHEVVERARQLMLRDGVSYVTIETAFIQLTFLHHNDFNGQLVIGSPRPNHRSWSKTWVAPRERRFGNNVRVFARWHPEEGKFAAYAVYNGRVLNRLDATSTHDVEEKMRFLAGAWKHASPSNVKDEAQDAPEWRENAAS
jgi:hypothetical protein